MVPFESLLAPLGGDAALAGGAPFPARSAVELLLRLPTPLPGSCCASIGADGDGARGKSACIVRLTSLKGNMLGGIVQANPTDVNEARDNVIDVSCSAVALVGE